MRTPKMPEIRQAIQQARDLNGREDTNEFAVEAPRLLTQLVAILDQYVGHEPTLGEEAAYKHRVEVLAEAVALIEAARADDEAMHHDEPAHINRRVGMREAVAVLRREFEPAPEPSRRPYVRRPALGKDTSDARQAPAGESTQPAPGTCGRALSTGQPCPDHPFVPRTEREYWVDIANALNAANAAGMPVGIDIEGILTDHHMWAVVWNRSAERWEVGGYEDDDTAVTTSSAEDWVICCSPSPRCPNGERRAKAVERGWTTNGRAGNWLCAEHSPDFFQPNRTHARRDGTTFQCFTVTTTPWNGQRLAIGWHTDEADITSIAWRGVGEWLHEYGGAERPQAGGAS